MTTENISGLAGNAEWQPACKPDEAEIHAEKFHVPGTTDYKTPDIRVITSKDMPAFSDEGNHTQDILVPKVKRDAIYGES